MSNWIFIFDFDCHWMRIRRKPVFSDAPSTTSAPIDILHRVSSSVYIIYERLFDSLPVQTPITSSQCWASILLSSTRVCREPSQTQHIFSRLWQFWQNFNIHFPVKYRGINGFGWQLIRQVRGRKRERQTWRDTFQALVVELRGWTERTAGSVNGGPQLISMHYSSVARCLFLSPNGCGSSVIID